MSEQCIEGFLCAYVAVIELVDVVEVHPPSNKLEKGRQYHVTSTQRSHTLYK